MVWFLHLFEVQARKPNYIRVLDGGGGLCSVSSCCLAVGRVPWARGHSPCDAQQARRAFPSLASSSAAGEASVPTSQD